MSPVKFMLKYLSQIAPILALATWFCLPAPAQAERYQEKQLSQALRQQLRVGEAVDLPLSPNSSFLAVYTKSFTHNSRGCVVLLHGLDAHLDWPQIIGPLRTQLPQHGWNTLSLQLETLNSFHRAKDYQALYRDTEKRLAAAIDFLKQRGIYNIVLLGHSLGGSMGLYYLDSRKASADKAIIAFVGVGMYDPNGIAAEYRSDNATAELKIPILDIYGTEDSIDVLNAAKLRKIAASKAGNSNFQQLALNGGDHFLSGLEQTAQKRIRLWITKQAPSVELESAGSGKSRAEKPPQR